MGVLPVGVEYIQPRLDCSPGIDLLEPSLVVGYVKAGGEFLEIQTETLTRFFLSSHFFLPFSSLTSGQTLGTKDKRRRIASGTVGS